MSEVEKVKDALWAAYLADPFGFWKGGAAAAAIAAIDEARGWRTDMENVPLRRWVMFWHREREEIALRFFMTRKDIGGHLTHWQPLPAPPKGGV